MRSGRRDRRPEAALTRLWLASVLLAFAWHGGLLATVVADRGTRAFDADRSHAEFRVRTLWLSAIQGRFQDITGFLRIREDGAAEVRAWVDMHGLAVADRRYAETLRSEDFFDIAHYDTMSFQSDAFPVERLVAGGQIDGWLRLRGQTRRVHFELQPAECRQPLSMPCTLELRGSIDRSDFGIRAYGLVVSQRVRLQLHITLAGTPT